MVGILAIISPLQRVLASGLAGQEAQVRSPLVSGDFRSEHMGVRGLRVRLGINGKPQASIHSGLKVWHFHVPLLHLGPQHEHCIHTLAEPVLNLYNFTSPAGKSFLIVFKLRCGYRKDCKGDSHLTNMERNLFSRFQMAAWKNLEQRLGRQTPQNPPCLPSPSPCPCDCVSKAVLGFQGCSC